MSCLLSVQPSFAVSLKHSVASCAGNEQYYKFANDFKKDEVGAFIVVKNFHIDTTLSTMTMFTTGSSEVFKNTFTDANTNILTGQAYFVDKDKQVSSLCGVTFSCDCSAESGCEQSVTAAGPRCSLEGEGEPGNPYVVNLK